MGYCWLSGILLVEWDIVILWLSGILLLGGLVGYCYCVVDWDIVILCLSGILLGGV